MEVTDDIKRQADMVVESVFKRWDKDHNGFLDKEEFRAKVLAHREASGYPEHEEENVDEFLERYFAKVDKDGDGQISKDEMKQHWIEEYLKRHSE